MTTRAFITGVGGQDGSYLAEQLLADGVDVHALAHIDDTAPPIPGVELHPGDLTRPDELRGLLLELAPDEIYNLAALSSVARSWTDPETTARVNGLAVAGLLETALLVQEKHGRPVAFVQASSAEIFGQPASSPQDERTPIAPTNPYGAAKAYAHHLVAVYRERDLHAVSAILYNHESPRRPTTFVTRKITSTVASIARGETDRLVLGNLEARRDWGWAPDYVDALIRAARHKTARDYVIATGVGHSVREFVAAAFAHAGISDWETLVRTDPEFLRPADAVELLGDASVAREHLGWSPSVGFDELVGRMVDADLHR
ncbi:GDP-mannose 4,6-dehydratase [Nocardioides sp.]|uniref:GDP-mannose 4,6-dehydratase n=1 Tax=Nocardioides sp. TaxID=35761 RepID=UPI003564ECFA